MQRAYGFARKSPAETTAAGATVNVFNNGTMVLATIFADNLSTPKSNPFTADATTGYWFWYAANGRYDVQVSGTGFTTYTLADVDLNDIFTLNGLTASTQTLITGNAGTDFNIVDTGPGTHTFNIPDASATARGLVTTGAQSWAGAKTLTTPLGIASGGTGLNAAPTNGQLLIGSGGTAFVVASLTGTANQIVVTPGAGSITLSTPQSIGTGSSPTFAGLVDSALASNQFGLVFVSDTLGTFAVTAPLTNGQLLVGSTGAQAVATTLTAGAGISITNTAGSITIANTSLGIVSINGLTSTSQTIVTGTTGSDFNVVSTGSSHTLNLPDASPTARGAITTGAQSLVGVKTFNNPPQYQAGASTTGPAIVSGVTNVNVAPASIAGSTSTSETNLMTFSLPANSLNVAGKCVRVTAAFAFTGAATQTKTARMYFGATQIGGTVASATNFATVAMTAYVFFLTSTTQFSFSTGTAGVNNTTAQNTTLNESFTSAPAETLTAAVTIKVTGQVGGNSSDTVTANSLIIETVG